MRLAPNPYFVALSVALAAGCATNENSALDEDLSAADSLNAAAGITDLGYILVSPNVANSPETIIDSSSSRVAYTFGTPNRAANVTVEVRGASVAMLQKLNRTRWVDVAELEAIRPPGSPIVQKHMLTQSLNGTYRVVITRIRPRRATDAGIADTGSASDAGISDAGASDAGASDAGASDAGLGAPAEDDSTIRIFAQDTNTYCSLGEDVSAGDYTVADTYAMPSGLTNFYTRGNAATKNRIASTLNDTLRGQAVRARTSSFRLSDAIASSGSDAYYVTSLSEIRGESINWYEMHSLVPGRNPEARGLVFRAGSSVPVFRLSEGLIQGCRRQQQQP